MPPHSEEAPPASDTRRASRQALAWCAHAYTGLGLILAAGMTLAILEGAAEGYHLAFVLMLAATFVDATDGTLARAVRVKEVLPSFSGRRLDDLIDFLTYVCLPLLLVYRAGILPPGWQALLLAPLIASAYGFCQDLAKTPDGYFLGFPSCWNVVAFYLYVLHTYVAPLPLWLSACILLGLSFLTFVPTRYPYATLPGKVNRLTALLSVPWSLLVGWVLWRLPRAAPGDPLLRQVILLSLAFPIYYLAISWLITWQRRRARAESALRMSAD